MVACPNCGAGLRFDPATQMLVCDYCGTRLSATDYQEEGAQQAGAEEQVVATEVPVAPSESSATPGFETYETTVYTCPQCGGELISEDTTAATFCSFCGASVVLEGRVSRERKPNYIIPFKKTREDCEEAYKKALRKAIFAPKYMKEDQTIERFRGIYMPYWVYSFGKNGPISMEGKISNRRGDYIITKHYRLDSNLDAQYEGISYDASSTFSDSLSSAIAPYDTAEKQPFESSYFSGFYADTSDVDAEVYQDNARAIVQTDILNRAISGGEYSRYSVSANSNAVRPEKESSELGMFPVWFLSCRHGDRISYAVVNGQTGKLAADIPISFGKYLLGSLILGIPIFILMNLFLTIKPTPVLILGIVLSFVSILISNSQLNKIHARENDLDDEGMQYAQAKKMAETGDYERGPATAAETVSKTVTKGAGGRVVRIILGIVIIIAGYALFRGTPITYLTLMVGGYLISVDKGTKTVVETVQKTKAKMPFGKKLPVLLKPIIGILVAVGVLIYNPVEDYYFYIGAIICMLLVVISFLDIVRDHNRLTLRKLPQFGKRGGDQYVD